MQLIRNLHLMELVNIPPSQWYNAYKYLTNFILINPKESTRYSKVLKILLVNLSGTISHFVSWLSIH